MSPRCLILEIAACSMMAFLASARAQETSRGAEPQTVESELKEAMLANIKATAAEDLAATMKTIHSNSPLYQTTRRQLTQVFGKYKGVRYELVSFTYLASDGDFAFARAVQRTTQTPPSAVKDNETDLLIAFRKESGTWKFWNQALLEYKLLKR